MAFALVTLRLDPHALWRLTLPELAAAVEALSPIRNAPLSPRDLKALIARFPDPEPRQPL